MQRVSTVSVGLVVLLAASALSAQDIPQAQPGPRLQSKAHFGSSPFDPPKADDSSFVVDQGGGLDSGCTFRSGGPLVFQIPVKRVLDAEHRDRLLANGLLSKTAVLRMPAFDVDFDAVVPPFNPERDRISFNGHVVPGEFLTGSNNVWKLNSFEVPIDWVEFADEGSGTAAQNEIHIDIDTANSEELWCTAIDWASLTLQMARPVVMVHGIFSNGGIWGNLWVPQLQQLGIYTDNDLNMGALDSIGSNAAKIAGEVEQAKQRFGVDKVDLVTHSKGGLDSRDYVEGQETVEKLVQLGTPNAGSPLADVAQGLAVDLVGIGGAAIVNLLAGPAGIQLTTSYMAAYNLFHGSNPKVEYTALGGLYSPDCIFCLDRLQTLIVGPGDTIVPLSSVHALSYTHNLSFASAGADRDATHTGLHSSLPVYQLASPPVRTFGKTATLAAPAGDLARTASAVGALQAGEVGVHTVPIDQATPVIVSLMYGAGDLQLVLTSPSGQRIDPAAAASDPNVEYDAGDVLGGRMAAYSLGAPEVGLWTAEVTAVSVADPAQAQGYAVHAWIEAPAVTLAADLAAAHLHSGDALTVLGTLRESGAPLLGASLVARVVAPGGSFVDLPLHDDGLDGDTTASDGVYSGRTGDTLAAGDYPVVVSASGTRSTGAAFSREDFTLATVSASHSSFAGFADRGVDTDGDGFFNQLVVDVDLDVTDAADYRVFGVLEDSAGNRHQAFATAHLDAGPGTVSLAFDGESLFQNRVDGPYTLAEVRLAEEGSLELLPVAEATDAHQTAAYAYTDFQHALIRLTGAGTAQGVDLDGNGLFDRLDVTVETEIDRAGFYQWSAQLQDRDGTELDFDAGAGFFSAGPNGVTLRFSGSAIGENGVDGPYEVTDLLLFGAGANLTAGRAFETPAFLASQFEGFSSDTQPPEISVRLDPTVLWPPNHRLVDVTATVQVSDDHDPSPRVALVAISADEPDNATADGHTANDVQGADLGADDRSFQLRAERRGNGDSRTYTVVYEATDAAGNRARATASVTVPHDLAGLVARGVR